MSHPYFDRFMMLVVILNCIEMAISVEFDRDSDPRNALHTALIASGNAFCVLVPNVWPAEVRNIALDFTQSLCGTE